MYLGWLWQHGTWHAQPSTRSRDMGKCSRKLGEAFPNVPNTHLAITGGAAPDFVPRQKRDEGCPSVGEEWEDL